MFSDELILHIEYLRGSLPQDHLLCRIQVGGSGCDKRGEGGWLGTSGAEVEGIGGKALCASQQGQDLGGERMEEVQKLTLKWHKL
jgi:hypothetical protein